MTELVDKIGPRRLVAMGAVGLALFAFFAFIMVRAFTTPMAPLFAELAMEDTADVTAELDAQGVEYTVERGGSAIMVPQEMVSKLRMDLAATGLPREDGWTFKGKRDALHDRTV
ncbi:MAG: flagellar M-ring protein FliF, partial [Planctomycetota bacterium]